MGEGLTDDDEDFNKSFVKYELCPFYVVCGVGWIQVHLTCLPFYYMYQYIVMGPHTFSLIRNLTDELF